MTDLDLEARLHDYYGTFTPADSGRAVAGVDRVVAAARARAGSRSGGWAGRTWFRGAAAAAVVAALIVAVLAPLWLRSNTGPVATSSPTPSPTSGATSSVPAPSARVNPTSSPSGNAADVSCPVSPNLYGIPHAFVLEPIPAGADACANVGTGGNPSLRTLTNEGPVVAFDGIVTGSDGANVWDLWLGDLRSGAVEVAYQAPAGNELASPQLAGGHLLWLEWTRQTGVPQPVGGPGGPAVIEWWLKDMDIGSRQIRTVAHDRAPGFGGTALASEIRFDGAHLGIAESLKTGSRIQVQDWPSLEVVQTVSVPDYLYDFALVGDGVLYSAGTYEYNGYGAVRTHLTYAPRTGPTRVLAQDVYFVAASGDVVAWLADPSVSAFTDSATSLPGPRVYVTDSKLGSAHAISPVPDGKPTVGIQGPIAVGSGTVAWWQQDGNVVVGRDALTLWTPGASSPVQLATGEALGAFSLGGGWLAWIEDIGSGDNLTTRVRAVPLSAVIAP